jgi:uncharacterized protein (TIGR03435 family)
MTTMSIMRGVRTAMRLGRTGLTTVAFLASGMALRAQDAAGGAPAKPVMMTKSADPDWEVATVHATDPSNPNGQRVRLTGRHVLLLNTTAEQFMLLGYGVQKSQLAGEPEWAKTERWNVDGVPDVEGEPNWAQIQSLMRKILAERFGLKVHHEQQEMPVYALTVGKSGPKMTPNTSDPDGLMDQQNNSGSGRDVENLKNASMVDLAVILQFRIGRPVVDQTGLKGRYDFKLQWTTDESQTTAPDAPPGIFTAIQEQIGLKLDAVKAPADVLVVDAVERPGAN